MSDRTRHQKMTYYRNVYRGSKRWKGEDTDEKTVIIYCEQGFGDIIQMARYFPMVKGNVILHCPKELQALFSNCLQGSYSFIDKWHPALLPHDVHILSFDLPLYFEDHGKPYLSVPGRNEPNTVGVCWKGNVHNKRDSVRSCSQELFNALHGDLVSLVPGEPTPLKDFHETAKLIASTDYVVSVDTAVMHLSAAMGHKTYGLLGEKPDPRWAVRRWYSSLSLLQGSWEKAIRAINKKEGL